MNQPIVWLDPAKWQAIALHGVELLVILAGTLLALGVSRRAMRLLEKRALERIQKDETVPSDASKRAQTFVKLTRQGVTVTIWVVAILVLLTTLGVDIRPILASAGIAGLALGFGAQNLVRDVISGFFLTMENQVRVGDVARINGTGGLVENIGLRTITLRDAEGTVHVFPNGTINTLANLTMGWSAAVFDIGVAYNEDTDRVSDVMRRVGAEVRADPAFATCILDDLELFGVDSFGDSAVVIKARIRTHPGKQWDVGREYRRRLKQAFDREGIEIPFPQRTVRVVEDVDARQGSGQAAVQPPGASSGAARKSPRILG
ncbi:MAG: mechanosensitive ion channel family protein [Nitrospirota bacterium]|nr:mechanosensitive ion channel family protein [Nitrospirota bacterium]